MAAIQSPQLWNQSNNQYAEIAVAKLEKLRGEPWVLSVTQDSFNSNRYENYASSEFRGREVMSKRRFAIRRLAKSAWMVLIFAISYGTYAIWGKWYVSVLVLPLLVFSEDVWTSYPEYVEEWSEQNARE